MHDAKYSGLDTVIIVSKYVIFIIYYVTILFRVYICNRKTNINRVKITALDIRL